MCGLPVNRLYGWVIFGLDLLLYYAVVGAHHKLRNKLADDLKSSSDRYVGPSISS